jgi:predicted transcriptional regulator
MNVEDITKRVDRAIADPIAVNVEIGGIALETMGQVMEFAKLMAVSGAAVPKYLRGNPGGCLAMPRSPTKS